MARGGWMRCIAALGSTGQGRALPWIPPLLRRSACDARRRTPACLIAARLSGSQSAELRVAAFFLFVFAGLGYLFTAPPPKIEPRFGKNRKPKKSAVATQTLLISSRQRAPTPHALRACGLAGPRKGRAPRTRRTKKFELIGHCVTHLYGKESNLLELFFFLHCAVLAGIATENAQGCVMTRDCSEGKPRVPDAPAHRARRHGYVGPRSDARANEARGFCGDAPARQANA